MILNNKIKIFFAIASFMMALGIALGAFGAHALKSILDEYFLKIYNTGIQYHFYNTLGLFAATFIYALKPDSKKNLYFFMAYYNWYDNFLFFIIFLSYFKHANFRSNNTNWWNITYYCMAYFNLWYFKGLI